MEYLVFISAAISLSFAIPYIIATLKGQVKPNKISWFLWALAPLIATLAALSAGVGWSVLPVFMSGFTPLLVFLSSFVNKDAHWEIQRFDWICASISILALILWYLTKNPNLAIIFSILADAMAGLPNIRKCWDYPETETGWIYYAGIFTPIASFFVIKDWNLAAVAFPVYLMLLNISLSFALHKDKFLKRS